jgi:thiamine-phosphate pyrophosphorylase
MQMIVMVSDRRRFGGLDRLSEAIARAVRAGVDVVQIRERDLDDRTLCNFVKRAVAVTRDTGARIVVNGRIDVALAAGADGVHLRGDSVPASRARAILPPRFLVGRSVHSRAEAQAVEADGGCDYLIFGAVFPSTSKPAGHEPAGLGTLQEVCQAVRVPVVAIGGVSAARAADVARAGAKGVAAIEAFATEDEPALGRIVDQMRRAFQ